MGGEEASKVTNEIETNVTTEAVTNISTEVANTAVSEAQSATSGKNKVAIEGVKLAGITGDVTIVMSGIDQSQKIEVDFRHFAETVAKADVSGAASQDIMAAVSNALNDTKSSDALSDAAKMLNPGGSSNSETHNKTVTNIKNTIETTVSAKLENDIFNKCGNDMLVENEAIISDVEVTDVTGNVTIAVLNVTQESLVKSVTECTHITNFISDVTQEVSTKLASEYSGEITSETSGTIDSLGSAIGDAAEGIGTGIGTAAEGLGTGIDSATDNASEIIDSAGDAASSVVSSMMLPIALMGVGLIAALVILMKDPGVRKDAMEMADKHAGKGGRGRGRKRRRR